MVKRWFIHYFETGAKSFSEQGGRRIADEARQLLKPDGQPFFDHIITYRKRDLGEDFIRVREAHFQQARGAGYWVWKSQIVKMTLDQMEMDDELLYCDTGCQIRGSLQPLFDLLEGQDVVPFHLEDCHNEYKWVKTDLIVKLGITNPEILKTPQRLSGYFLIRKSPQSLRLVDEYVRVSSDLHMVDDSPSLLRNHPEFIAHRHDQSVLSLLTKLHQIKSYPDPGWPLETCTTIAAARLVY